jgi:hypothetical protein
VGRGTVTAMTPQKREDERFDPLANRFASLSVEQGRELYDSLSPEEKAAMDERGLRRTWAAMRAAETRERKRGESWQSALRDAEAKRRRRQD